MNADIFRFISLLKSSQLSNAVMADKGIPIDASDDLDTLTALGVYTFVRSGIPQNAPPDLTDGGKVYVVAGNSDVALRQKIVSVYGVEYSRTQNDPSSAWRAWTKTALATPPQEFDLPLAAGFTADVSATYSKSQESVVHLSGSVYKENGFAVNDVVATLPSGFRPASVLTRPAVLATTAIAAVLRIGTDGAISVINFSGTGKTYLKFDIQFPAAD